MKKLIYVYNATSGKLSGLLDVAHKLISPKTYQCKLCAITHDTFLENEQWKQFRKNFSLPLEFLHSDEFEKNYKKETIKYPVILLKENENLTAWIPKNEIEQLETTQALIELIQLKTKNFSNLH